MSLKNLCTGCFGGKKKKKGESGAQYAGWSSQVNTTGKTKTTLLVNQTENTLVLRDKISAGYGQIRYTLPKKSETMVTSVSHTFFRMLAYAIEEEQKDDNKVRDTMLSVDSEELADYDRIIIYKVDGVYKLDKK